MDQRKRNLLFVVMGMVAALAVLAVSMFWMGSRPQETVAKLPATEENLPVAATNTGLPTETAGESQPAEHTQTVEGAETADPEMEVVPTARVGLQGTDPGTVNLASGDIQLVEFFAFW